MQPPLLPDEVLIRVYRLARRDGRGVLFIASAFSLIAAFMGDMAGAIIGLCVAGTGALELHGCHLLREGEPRGTRWLIVSQLSLMAVILAYCSLRLLNFDPALVQQALTPEIQDRFRELGYSKDQITALIKKVYHLTYTLVAIITVVYQGMMARYYHRRRHDITRALTEE